MWMLSWIGVHGLALWALALADTALTPSTNTIMFFGLAPTLGLLQAGLLPPVEGRWQWPVLTSAGMLIGVFTACLYPWHVGFVLGLSQFSLLKESGYRRAGLWLLASTAGWLAGEIASVVVTGSTFPWGTNRPDSAAIVGVVYGSSTAFALRRLKKDGRQPRQPWSTP